MVSYDKAVNGVIPPAVSPAGRRPSGVIRGAELFFWGAKECEPGLASRALQPLLQAAARFMGPPCGIQQPAESVPLGPATGASKGGK